MKWIDINHKRPKPISSVLVWTNVCQYQTLALYTENDWLYLSPQRNFWLNSELHIKVLFWMELPEPPLNITNNIYDLSNMD